MGRRLQTRRERIENRALVRLTVSYLAVFATVVGVLSAVAYGLVESNYRSIVAPALDTSEGRAALAAAMRPALGAIAFFDALLLVAVGAASYALARAALEPLVVAREREERFAADVAHELRAPLAAIASVAQAATETDAAAALATVARRSIEASALIGDLLTLARIGDADALVREPVDLAMLAHRVVRDWNAAPARTGVTIACDASSAIVDGDERRIVQLLNNLLANAVAHARTCVRLRVGVEGERAVVRIDDDGPGVRDELAPRLFERFAKGDESSGTGLGLAICRWVATAHGGAIAFEGGSRFVVALPLA